MYICLLRATLKSLTLSKGPQSNGDLAKRK
jgi:hypothetical protein